MLSSFKSYRYAYTAMPILGCILYYMYVHASKQWNSSILGIQSMGGLVLLGEGRLGERSFNICLFVCGLDGLMSNV